MEFAKKIYLPPNSPFKFQNGGPFCFSLALPTIYRYLTKLFVLTQSPLLAKQEIFWPIFHKQKHKIYDFYTTKSPGEYPIMSELISLFYQTAAYHLRTSVRATTRQYSSIASIRILTVVYPKQKQQACGRCLAMAATTIASVVRTFSYMSQGWVKRGRCLVLLM